MLTDKSIFAAVLMVGCAVPTDTTQHEPDVLGVEALALAEQQQVAFAQEGMALDVRVWLEPDAFVAFYGDDGSAAIGVQYVGPDSLLAGVDVPRPDEDESSAEFIERLSSARLGIVRDRPTDLIAFEPKVARRGVAAVTAALSDVETVAQIMLACDARATRFCSGTVGYDDYGSWPSVVRTWSHTNVNSSSHGATGSGSMYAVCAHGGGVSVVETHGEFSVYSTSPEFSAAPRPFPGQGFDVPPLAFHSMWYRGGWIENCTSHRIGGACRLGADYFRSFRHWRSDYAVAGKGGFPVFRFCGKVTSNRSSSRGDDPCRDTLTCPPPIDPSTFGTIQQ